jgi:hypothetical protein
MQQPLKIIIETRELKKQNLTIIESSSKFKNIVIRKTIQCSSYEKYAPDDHRR